MKHDPCIRHPDPVAMGPLKGVERRLVSAIQGALIRPDAVIEQVAVGSRFIGIVILSHQYGHCMPEIAEREHPGVDDKEEATSQQQHQQGCSPCQVGKTGNDSLNSHCQSMMPILRIRKEAFMLVAIPFRME